MPVSPHLLNQAAQGTESPLSSFLPAFQNAQDRQLRTGLLEEERQQRHQQNKLKWAQYVQEQKALQEATQSREAFQSEFGALDPQSPDYGMQAHRLATQHGQKLEGASLIPKIGEMGEVATFNKSGKLIQAPVGSPEYQTLVSDPEAILRNTPSSTDFASKDEGLVPWSGAYADINGKQVPVFRDSKGNAYMAGGAPVPPESIRAGSIEGAPEAFGGDKTFTKEFQERWGSYADVNDMLNNTISTIERPGSYTNVVGSLVTLADSLVGQAKQAASALGGKAIIGDEVVDESRLLEVGRYDDLITRLREQNASDLTAITKSNMVALAYSIARIRDPSARLSDADVRNAMESLWANAGNKETTAAVLEETQAQMNRSAGRYYDMTADLREDVPVDRDTFMGRVTKAGQRKEKRVENPPPTWAAGKMRVTDPQGNEFEVYVDENNFIQRKADGSAYKVHE